MQRYFINGFLADAKTAFIRGNDVHHIKHVMRQKVADELIVCDQEGRCFLASIASLSNDEVQVDLRKELADTSTLPYITIAQALIRRERFEYMLQKSTELGVSNIIPVKTTNTIIKLDQKAQKKKQERWNLLTKEASEQSHRNSVPTVEAIATLEQLPYEDYDVVLVAYEKEHKSNYLKTVLQKKPMRILVVIGPEGGFTEKEITTLENRKNVHLVGLGRRILRSETASSYILSVLSYEYEMSEQR